MRYPPAVLEQIKLRLNLVDEVRRVVPALKKKGRYWWAPCPFHGEKTPSFHVREEGNYYCFGCGAAGDIFTFVQETRGGTFPQVVEELAQRAGVQLPKREDDNPQSRSQREDGLKALSRATTFFQRNLGEEAPQAYLARRALSPTTREEFGLGYAPDNWHDLRDALLSEGFSADILRTTGLTLESNKGKGDYDRFRGRLMFPIHNLRGDVVAFGGRVLGQGEPKYLNSPETPFFSKSNLLFNLHRAREHIKKNKQALLVEGYMDAISLWQAGIKTALAPMGTSVTPEQISLLWQHAETPLVCLDGDSAGRTAALRVAQKALPLLEPGKSLGFVFLPDGEDPDSLIQKDGAAAFHRLLATPTALENVLWQHATQGQDVTTADGRSTVEGAIARLLADIRNATVRRAYQQVLKDKLFQASRPAFQKGGAKPGGKLARGSTTATQDYRPAIQGDTPARLLLALACSHPPLMAQHTEVLATLTFPPGPLMDLHGALLRALSRGQAAEDIVPQLMDMHRETLADLTRSTGAEGLPEGTTPQSVFDETLRLHRQRQSQSSARAQLKQQAEFSLDYFNRLQKATRRVREGTEG